MIDLTEKTLAAERKYTGKIISVDLLDIELPDGRKAIAEEWWHFTLKDEPYPDTYFNFPVSE